MKLSEQQHIILFSLIRFYTRPQDEFLKKTYGDELFLETNNIFKKELESFVNKKIAIDRIYTSLNNAAQTYIIFRQMTSNGTIGTMGEVNEQKIFMSFNESFISSLIINFSKLREVLTFKKIDIIKDKSLCESFAYLDGLNNRITNAGITGLRNGWFAHAFEDERKGIVYRDKDIKDSIFTALEKICCEIHLQEFKGNKDRLRFFCEQYLFEAIVTVNLTPKSSGGLNREEVNISTKPKEIVRELNLFSRKIMEYKLYGVESFFVVEDDEIKKWSCNPKEYFYENLKSLG
ncbi:hypothetical protein ACKVM6_03575 [Pantoea agglomerans]|uniref:hypothetical protein n=1 Tax=Enterobacter agglomerans TaxID=549 RepID=UPI00390A9BD6